MHPLLNPAISLPFLKNYLADPGRIQRLSPEQLQRYRNRALRNIISYASTVPLYDDAYKKTHLDISNIRGIPDIVNHPFISKQDIQNNFPHNIIPHTYNKKYAYVVSTGGTSGKPVSLYTDFQTILRAMGPLLAQMRYFKLPIRKIRIAHIGNFNRYRIDGVVQERFFPYMKRVYRLENSLNIDVNEPVKTIMEKLNGFKPDLIISYPALFQHLAFLKKKGYGEHVSPTLLQVGGDILDEYTRQYVEDAFGCRLLNIYPSVEAQANIAFECFEGSWHIHSDFFHVEAVDQNQDLVACGERGHLVLTRLWGKGTPIIRYTGMDDWVSLAEENETCSCGLRSPLFKRPVEGRMRTNIVLPNGKVFPPGAFCFIEPVLHDLKTYKVKQYQIIQKKINEIEILLVIDEDLRSSGASVEKIAEEITKMYQTKTGPEVTIRVREVAEIKAEPNSGKPAPIVISFVSREEGYRQLNK